MRIEFAPMLGPADSFPIGSLEWAERISNRLQTGVDHLSRTTTHHLLRTMEQIWNAHPRPWEIWPEDCPFGTPDDYCRAVTGHPWKALIAMAKEMGEEQERLDFRDMEAELAKAQAKHRKQGAHHAHGKMKAGSNQASYLLRRLARDHPLILEQYKRGEFKSVRAAAKAAGLIKESTPLDRIDKLLPKLNADDLRWLRQKIETLLEITA